MFSKLLYRVKDDGCRPNSRSTDKVSFSMYRSFSVFVAAFISVLGRLSNNGGKAFENLENPSVYTPTTNVMQMHEN